MEESMSREELVSIMIDQYVDLQRIKKVNGGVVNEELEYQIKGAMVKLSALGVHVAGLAL